MKLSNVKLVFRREMRDQLRDRRTLFTIGVIPLLLYPLMGMAMLQMAQFMQKTSTKILLVGSEHIPEDSGLVVDGRLNEKYLKTDDKDLVEFETVKSNDPWGKILAYQPENEKLAKQNSRKLRRLMRRHGYDLAVRIVPAKKGSDEPFTVSIFSNSSNDKSKLAVARFNEILYCWKNDRVQEKLAAHNLSLNQFQSAPTEVNDVADKMMMRATFWAKVLPFVIMIWSLTGAFYPAIDLCAGEKERGTLETLLCSPAKRSEIVVGKIMTTMLFSITTSVLNLVSMAFTGLFVAKHLGGDANPVAAIGPPPMSAIFWLILALIPISALFSALAIAVAAFARSSKEGQYYLMPLIMIAMPLVMLPMLPSSTLNLGTSLIPLTGLMLLLRTLIEGHYTQAIAFVGPVTIVTVACCWFAARWAIGQFSNESVLFRASDRVGLGNLVRHVIRERQDTPLIGHAIFCGVLILVLKFFVGLSATPQMEWNAFARTTVIVLIATVAMPAVIMALMLTRSARKTWLLDRLNLRTVPLAIFLAFCLHPAFMILSRAVLEVFPPSSNLNVLDGYLSQLVASAPSLPFVLLIMALAPAVFEELAFRGFILSGLRHIKNHWWPIFISALFFGAAHAVLQQSIVTFFVGIVLAMVAVRCGSLLPCIAYHATHNALSIVMSGMFPSGNQFLPGLLLPKTTGGYDYAFLPSILMISAGALILIWMWFGGLEKSRLLTLDRWTSRLSAWLRATRVSQ